MEDLLPYFERELVYLNTVGRELARQYPKLAEKLASGDDGGDPHVRRLIQACALLNARTAKKLDDDYPEFTEALLGSLYPHFLHGVPACAIAQAQPGAVAAPAQRHADIAVVARGTELRAVHAPGAAVFFRTTAPLALAPVTVARAWFTPHAQLAPGLVLPPRASGRISMTLESSLPLRMLPQIGLPRLRLQVDADGLLGAALLDALLLHVAATWVEPDGSHAWRHVDALPVRLGGLATEDALLPAPAHAHPAYRLLLEYFAFPAKFQCLEIALAQLAPLLPAACTRATLHFVLSNLVPDSAPARVLGALEAGHLLTGCTPVINLFRHSASPIRLTGRQTLYEVLPGRHQDGVEVYSVDAVRLLGTQEGRVVPLAGSPGPVGETPGAPSWFARHTRHNERRHVQIGFNGVDAGAVASIELTCTNGRTACQLAGGSPGGDLACDVATGGMPIVLLRRPTAPLSFGSREGLHWQLVTQLALNHRTLGDVEALRQTLALYDLARSTSTQHLVAGITAVELAPGSAWLRTPHGMNLLHGIDVKVTLDEEAFAGTGVAVFGHVLSHFLGLYVHINSFTRLTLVSGQHGKELMRCDAKSGSLTLL